MAPLLVWTHSRLQEISVDIKIAQFGVRVKKLRPQEVRKQKKEKSVDELLKQLTDYSKINQREIGIQAASWNSHVEV